MNKEDWLKLKKSKEISIEALYEFWKTNKKPQYKDLTLGEFEDNIRPYIQHGGRISSERVTEYFDNVFFITKTFDKTGNLIKET